MSVLMMDFETDSHPRLSDHSTSKRHESLISEDCESQTQACNRQKHAAATAVDELIVSEVPQSQVLSPPDGGWGWFIVLGCFLMNFIVNGISYSFGVIFMELLDSYERTSADIAWVYSLNCVTCSWLGPFATALGNAFSFRLVVVVGGFIYSIGIIASSFATKLEVLYVTYGLISGLGSALVYGPSIIMVGRYFDKRRSLANGLSAAGSGVGSFLLPPIMGYLIDKFGIHGCILILGAASLHLCVAGLLYRSVPMRRVIIEQPDPVSFDGLPSSKIGPEDRLLQVPSIVITRVSTQTSIKEELYETALYPTRGGAGFMLGSSLLSIPENIVTVVDHPSNRSRHFSGDGVLKYLRRAALFLYAWPKTLRNGTNLSQLFDFSLLKERLFLMFTSAVMLASFGYLSIYLIISSHAMDLDFGKTEAVYLVSVIGICDLCGRVGFGWISDFQFVSRKWGFSLMVMFAAISVALGYFASSYMELLIFCSAFGFFGGSFMVMNAVLTADLFGLDRLPSAFGLLITIQGIAFLVGPPAIGAIRDYCGTFQPVFIVIVAVMTVGASLLPLENLISHFLRKSRRLSGNSSTSAGTTVTVAFLPETIKESLVSSLAKPAG